MGVRAVATVVDLGGSARRYYAQWASPEYQIPYLADFITWADQTSQPLNTDSYHRYATENPGTLPAEDVTDTYDDESAGDLDYRYHLTLAEETRWLRFVVYDVRQHGRIIHTIVGRPEVYTAAAHICEEAAARAQTLAQRAGGASLPGANPCQWREAAV